MKQTKTICIDFDGVIHSYMLPFTTPEKISDPPVRGAFEFIKQCLKEGYVVAVFSSRSRSPSGLVAMKEWFVRCGYGDYEDVNELEFPTDKPMAVLYIDDRAFHFKGEFPSLSYVNNFIPWNRTRD